MAPYQLFLNRAGRLRSGWRLVIFILIYAALLYLISTLVRVAFGIGLLMNLSPSPFVEDFIFRLILLSSGILAGWICTHWLEGLPWRALGLTFHSGWLRDLLVGSIVGAFSLVIAAAIALAAGGLRLTLSAAGMLFPVLRTLVATAVLFIIAALAEEVTFRGYPLQTFTRARLGWFGVLSTAAYFGAVHLQNPNVTVLSFTNTTLAGVWLAVAYLRTRSLWFPLGVHWAWNWAQGSLFDIRVSGIHISDNSVMNALDKGPAWLTGGSYGIEGGAACTIAVLISTVFIWRTRLVSATTELEKLTSEENPVRPKQHYQIFPETNRGSSSLT